MSDAPHPLPGSDSEFAFELAVCRWAERNWPPGEPGTRPVIVGRQLGTRRRRWDTVVIEIDAEAYAAREAFGPSELDSDLLHVVRHAPAEWAWYRDALPDPGYPWRYVREAIHDAADRGAVETRRGGNNRIEIRRIAPYPDWVQRVVAIENKPDLDASAARQLVPQLERDVAVGLADEVWVATTATGEPIEPALLEPVPVEAGILAVDPDAGTGSVEWHPSRLPVDAPGTRILERPSGSRYDQSAATFEYVDPAEKAERRLVIAERAYERGWRSFLDTMRPDCRHFGLGRRGEHLAPWCSAKGKIPTNSECSGYCPEFEPEPPVWRTKGWPIEGGPGKGIRRVLERRRDRERPQ